MIFGGVDPGATDAVVQRKSQLCMTVCLLLRKSLAECAGCLRDIGSCFSGEMRCGYEKGLDTVTRDSEESAIAVM